jgi:hypothetical protein
MMMIADAIPNCPRRSAVTLRPAVRIRPATGTERRDARPWTMASGVADYEVAEFADGGTRHAPETVAALRAAMRGPVVMLIYVHRGQKIESMMPLLPSLLFATGYRGASCAIRVGDETGADVRIRRFAAGQVPDKGLALLVVDRQERIAPPGRLVPATVEIAVLEHKAAPIVPPACPDRMRAAEGVAP